MVKYRYEIHCYAFGDIYDKYSSWHQCLDTCEFNCLKTIHSKKLKETLFNNECANCKMEIYIVCDVYSSNILQQQTFTQYKIIKQIKNVSSISLLEHEEKVDFEENIKFRNRCEIMKKHQDEWRKQPNNEVLNLLTAQIKKKCGYTPNDRWINMAYMLKIDPLELSWKEYEDNCEFRAELAEKLNITQKELFDRYTRIFDIDLVASNLHIGYKLKNDMKKYLFSQND
jgi:hypothetical protein